jgi:hypothetical protein
LLRKTRVIFSTTGDLWQPSSSCGSCTGQRKKIGTLNIDGWRILCKYLKNNKQKPQWYTNLYHDTPKYMFKWFIMEVVFVPCAHGILLLELISYSCTGSSISYCFLQSIDKNRQEHAETWFLQFGIITPHKCNHIISWTEELILNNADNFHTPKIPHRSSAN